MPKKQIKKQLVKDLQKALRGREYLLEDLIIESDYLEAPIEYVDLLIWDTIEEILKKYNYYLTIVTKNTIVYRKRKGVVNW